jgi:hypothetical protein
VSVFIIIDAWVGFDGTEGQEVVGAKYFETESDALDALSDIADSYGVTLDVESTNFTLEDVGPNVEWEEYYIQELTRG